MSERTGLEIAVIGFTARFARAVHPRPLAAMLRHESDVVFPRFAGQLAEPVHLLRRTVHRLRWTVYRLRRTRAPSPAVSAGRRVVSFNKIHAAP